MEQWEDEHLDLVRSILRRYQDTYRGQVFDYLSILDMTASELEDDYAWW